MRIAANNGVFCRTCYNILEIHSEGEVACIGCGDSYPIEEDPELEQVVMHLLGPPVRTDTIRVSQPVPARSLA